MYDLYITPPVEMPAVCLASPPFSGDNKVRLGPREELSKWGGVPNIDSASDWLQAVCRKRQVCELSLFGSVLRDDFGPQSDVDVLVSFADDAPWSLWDFTTMRDELSALFGRRVDLVEREGLRNPFRRYTILKTREVIYVDREG